MHTVPGCLSLKEGGEQTGLERELHALSSPQAQLGTYKNFKSIFSHGLGDGSRPLADFDREGGSTIRCTHIIQHRSDALFLTTCIGEGLDETLLCPSWETG